MRNFLHIFFCNTIHDAWCSLAYHLSELHIATESPNQWVIMLVPFSTSATGSLRMHSRASASNGAGCSQVLLLFGKLLMANNEMVNTLVLECNTSLYKPLEVYAPGPTTMFGLSNLPGTCLPQHRRYGFNMEISRVYAICSSDHVSQPGFRKNGPTW